MASRRSRRPQWRMTENGTWTLSLGERGYRVRLFENREKGGTIYREVQLPGGKKSRCSLGTRDRERAQEVGLQLVASLMSGKDTRLPSGPVRLGELCKRFLVECPMLLDNTEKDREDAETRLAIVRAAIGEAR